MAHVQEIFIFSSNSSTTEFEFHEKLLSPSSITHELRGNRNYTFYLSHFSAAQLSAVANVIGFALRLSRRLFSINDCFMSLVSWGERLEVNDVGV